MQLGWFIIPQHGEAEDCGIESSAKVLEGFTLGCGHRPSISLHQTTLISLPSHIYPCHYTPSSPTFSLPHTPPGAPGHLLLGHCLEHSRTVCVCEKKNNCEICSFQRHGSLVHKRHLSPLPWNSFGVTTRFCMCRSPRGTPGPGRGTTWPHTLPSPILACFLHLIFRGILCTEAAFSLQSRRGSADMELTQRSKFKCHLSPRNKCIRISDDSCGHRKSCSEAPCVYVRCWAWLLDKVDFTGF